MAAPARPFSNAALIAEFERIKGSGRAEEAIQNPVIRLQLIRSIAAQLREQRKTALPRQLADDYKRRQANDLD